MTELNKVEIMRIKSEIDRRCKILADILQHKDLSKYYCLMKKGKLDRVHKEMIENYVVHKNIPPRPDNERWLLKQFVCSTTSQANIRERLKKFNDGETYDVKDVPKVLAKLFGDDRFLDDNYWNLHKMQELVDDIRSAVKKRLPELKKAAIEKKEAKKKLDKNELEKMNRKFSFENYKVNNRDKSLPLQLHVWLILKTGSRRLEQKTINGLEQFYQDIGAHCKDTSSMLSFAKKFATPSKKDIRSGAQKIRNVDDALSCDFFKEMGFKEYLKLDYHISKEFPSIVNKPVKEFSKEGLFQSFRDLAEKLGMTPFHLDKILYLWGYFTKKNKKKICSHK